MLIKLNLLPQQVIYRSFSFKKVKGGFASSNVRFGNLLVPFSKKLDLQSAFTTSSVTGLRALAKCNVLEVRSSFLLLGTGQKYTRLQPKFKTAFPRTLKLVCKNLLFGSFKVLPILYSACFFKLKSNPFCLESIIYRSFLVCSSKKHEMFFFYSRPYYFFLSYFQKKVNFVQFNALLKSVCRFSLI